MYPGLHFLFALGTPLRKSRKTLHEWKDNSVLANPSQHVPIMYHLSWTVSQLFEPQVRKIARFHVPQPTFLFPLETPLRLSRNMLHGWKDNSMLVKPLASCTHLSSTVSQLFEPQLQKLAVFTYRSPHFCFPWRRPCGYHPICSMDGKTIQCLQNPSEKLEWLGYHMVKNFEDTFIRFGATHERDRRTDRQTETGWRQ